ncbi:MAG TPA: hypothetical protein VHB98_14900, partial [Chloroflexota bacterium]|nr:hypothetical protein [Chloroflexota bacterium]
MSGSLRRRAAIATRSLILALLLVCAVWPAVLSRQTALAPGARVRQTRGLVRANSLAALAPKRARSALAPGSADNAPPVVATIAYLPVQTDDPRLNRAEQVALRVLERNASGGLHLAAPFYNSTWIRDSYAWGMIPWTGSAAGALDTYSGTELWHWLSNQRPDGFWITNSYSGWYDETPIMIAAIADSYRLSGNRRSLRAQLPRAQQAWSALAQREVRLAAGSRYLLFAQIPPHTAADWADQVARSGYATGLEALWYHATRSMATMEAAVGDARRAARFAAFARGIKADINRLLWRVSVPHARNAPPAGPTGHYTGWLGARDYFELDSNYLCILYGIASHARAADILRFTAAHAAYLLGLGAPRGIPARTVYGDYEPADYARIHYNLADGRYQNGYWPGVGALVAVAGA